MTLIKSILLGTAAGMVVVSGAAQAADLPTKKAAPAADYVKICNVNGMAGFIIPGSDTCLKIGGFVLGLYSYGNLKTQYKLNAAGTGYGPDPTLPPLPGPPPTPDLTGAGAIIGTAGRDSFGMSARVGLNFDTATNTAYGPLVTSVQIRGNASSGDGSGIGQATGNGFALDHAWISWAGITAGNHGSFYNGLGEGNLWDDYYTPDTGGNAALLAYTATFGGGFSATIAAESTDGHRANVTDGNQLTNVYHGIQYPDAVVNLDLKQGWGEVSLSAAAHNSNILLGQERGEPGSSGINKWGYGVNGGVKFNLPGFSGDPKNPDTITFQGDYSKGALKLSGYSAGNVIQSGNGTLFTFVDQYEYLPGVWASPSAWSAAANMVHHFSPQLSLAPEISYLSINYGSGPTDISTKLTSWKGGAIAHWYPLSSSALDFRFEVMYTRTTESTPAAFIPNPAQPFVGTSDGFIARVGVERDF